MKPIDLYNKKPIRTDHCIYNLNGIIEEWTEVYEDPNKRIEMCYYFNKVFDSRRTMELFSVKMDSQFIMVVQKAGREASDHRKVFITNLQKYIEMLKYIRMLGVKDDRKYYKDELCSKKIDIKSLTHFYGYDISEDVESLPEI